MGWAAFAGASGRGKPTSPLWAPRRRQRHGGGRGGRAENRGRGDVAGLRVQPPLSRTCIGRAKSSRARRFEFVSSFLCNVDIFRLSQHANGGHRHHCWDYRFTGDKKDITMYVYFTGASYAPSFPDRPPWVAFPPTFFSLLSRAKLPVVDRLSPRPAPASTAQQEVSRLEPPVIKTW